MVFCPDLLITSAECPIIPEFSIQSKFKKLILFTHKCPFFLQCSFFYIFLLSIFLTIIEMTIRRSSVLCAAKVANRKWHDAARLFERYAKHRWWSVASQEAKTIKMRMKLLKLLGVYKAFSCLHLCQWHLKYFERRKWRLDNHQSRPLIIISLRSCKAII